MTGTVFPLISNSISSSSSQESTGSSGSSSSPLPQIMKHSNSTENQASSEIETTLTETTTRIHKMFNKQIGKKYADLKPSFSIQWDLEDRKWNCTIALKTEFKTRSYVWDLEEEEYIFPELIAHKYIPFLVQTVTPLKHEGQSAALNIALADILVIAFGVFGTKSIDVDWITSSTHDLSETVTMKDDFSEPNEYISRAALNNMNSQIPGHTFYLSVSSDLTTLFWRILRIWLTAWQDNEPGSSITFKYFANKTVQIAACATNSDDTNKRLVQVLVSAWLQTGVYAPIAVQPIELVANKTVHIAAFATDNEDTNSQLIQAFVAAWQATGVYAPPQLRPDGLLAPPTTTKRRLRARATSCDT